MSAYRGIRNPSGIHPGSGLLLPLLGALVVLAGCVSPGSSGDTARTVEPSTGTGADPTETPETDVPQTDTDLTATPARAPTLTPGRGDQPPALESRLYRLVTAENRTAYAASRGLRLRNGSVLAVIELRPGRELPASFDLTIRTSYRNLVQAFVPVDDLVPIADDGNISFVRPPREAATDSSSIDSPRWLISNSPSGQSRFRSY